MASDEKNRFVHYNSALEQVNWFFSREPTLVAALYLCSFSGSQRTDWKPIMWSTINLKRHSGNKIIASRYRIFNRGTSILRFNSSVPHPGTKDHSTPSTLQREQHPSPGHGKYETANCWWMDRVIFLDSPLAGCSGIIAPLLFLYMDISKLVFGAIPELNLIGARTW